MHLEIKISVKEQSFQLHVCQFKFTAAKVPPEQMIAVGRHERWTITEWKDCFIQHSEQNLKAILEN